MILQISIDIFIFQELLNKMQALKMTGPHQSTPSVLEKIHTRHAHAHTHTINVFFSIIIIIIIFKKQKNCNNNKKKKTLSWIFIRISLHCKRQSTIHEWFWCRDAINAVHPIFWNIQTHTHTQKVFFKISKRSHFDFYFFGIVHQTGNSNIVFCKLTSRFPIKNALCWIFINYPLACSWLKFILGFQCGSSRVVECVGCANVQWCWIVVIPHALWAVCGAHQTKCLKNFPTRKWKLYRQQTRNRNVQKKKKNLVLQVDINCLAFEKLFHN